MLFRTTVVVHVFAGILNKICTFPDSCFIVSNTTTSAYFTLYFTMVCLLLFKSTTGGGERRGRGEGEGEEWCFLVRFNIIVCICSL